MTEELTLEKLRDAVSGTAAAFRCVTEYQPAGGPGDKVFPPTYSGGVYAFENRRINGKVVPCVLLDSVQSQANRMELALLDVWEREEDFSLPVIVVDFSQSKLPAEVGRNWRVTSLEVPHRIADAILRDSKLDNGTLFKDSEYAEKWGASRVHDATALFRLCPTALVFGTWGSPKKPGGLGAKFARAIVSEIIGIDVEFGIRTSSRIDPLGIQKSAGPLYKKRGGGWTRNPDEAEEKRVGNKTKKILFGPGKGGKPVPYDPEDAEKGKYPKEGRPSVAGHGSVTPSFTKYTQGAEGPDPLRLHQFESDYRVHGREGEMEASAHMRSSEVRAYEGQIAPGGITMSHALQSTVLSLPGLRRLRFPLEGETVSKPDIDNAARTVLAALALCAAASTREHGCDLRSRCQLFPTGPIVWELLDKPGGEPTRFLLSAEQAKDLYKEAVENLPGGLTWKEREIKLKPSEELVELVKRSQELEMEAAEEEED